MTPTPPAALKAEASSRPAIRAPRSCKGWCRRPPLRMLMNNLDPEVAERPEELVVYGGSGKAARRDANILPGGMGR